MLAPLILLAAASTALAAESPFPPFSGDPFEKYNIYANNINASFIPYGARLTNLYVPDRNGTPRDIVVGYDETSNYTSSRTYFGAVVGRYANRIKNGTFSLDGETFHIPENEHDGEDTLHGGTIGYDMRNWTMVSNTNNSVTFAFYDEAFMGFPGDVLNIATYTVTDAPAFISRLVSIPIDRATPIMLANHIYWNIGGWVNQEAQHVYDTTLWMPYADRWINIDGIEVPTGNISMTNGTALDFTEPKTIGQDINTTVNGCGTGCTGYDNAFILDRPRYAVEDPDLMVLRWTSPDTGIKMELQTNHQGLQIYTCNTLDGTIPAKADQQLSNTTTYYDQYGCMVIESQDWIDAIDYPEWGRQYWQIFSPTTYPALNYQKYQFSTFD